MDDTHKATPNSECKSVITPDSQNGHSTVPESIAKLISAAAHRNDSEGQKITSKRPGL